MSAARLTPLLELVGRVNSPRAVVVLIGFYGKAGGIQKYFPSDSPTCPAMLRSLVRRALIEI